MTACRLQLHPLAWAAAWLLAIGGWGQPLLAQRPADLQSLLLPEDPRSSTQPTTSRPDHRITRERLARINTIAIESIDLNHQPSLRFNLFDDASFDAIPTMIEARTNESFTICGHLPEIQGDFVLAVENDAVVANIWSASGGWFQIRSSVNGLHAVQELNASGFAPCDCGPQHSFRANASANVAANTDAGANTALSGFGLPGGNCEPWIDVLVLYTEAAAAGAGGDNAIRALAYASIASAHVAYQASGIHTRLRLAHLAKISYVESGNFSLDLSRLHALNDGHLDQAHALRDEHNADLVVLLAGGPVNSCGVAFIMNAPSPSFANLAFSVVHQSCAVSNLSFVHEIGHNLGCSHDYDDPISGAFAYSRGHRFTGDGGVQWRTVMAGSPGVRVARFSNPRVLFDGQPTGVPVGRTGQADNALTINTLAPLVASFRIGGYQDCNSNSEPDHCDIAAGISEDLNLNGVPDECEAPPCDAHSIQRLSANDAGSFDHFGLSVAASTTRIVVGAESAHHVGNLSGAAYVFRREGDRWVQEAKLIGQDTEAFDRFGHAVAISSDDQFILIGAHREGGFNSDEGSIYVFRREGKQWIQEAKLISPDPQQQDLLGWSLSVSRTDAGELLAASGAMFDDSPLYNAGAIYVFKRDAAGQWMLDAVLTANDASEADQLGYSVAISGNRIVAGATSHDGAGTSAGAAYVFVHDHDGVWSQQAKLVPSDAAAGDVFGLSVAIDGDRIVVGSRSGAERCGAAYVFEYQGGVWLERQKLTPMNPQPLEGFGIAVGVRGENVLVGSRLSTWLGIATGAVYVFTPAPAAASERASLGAAANSAWVQYARIVPPGSAALDHVGSAVSIASDGTTAAVGAMLDDIPSIGAVDGGSVAVFSLQNLPPDCNDNTQPDSCDIANGVSVDRNHNGVPDECEAPATCLGDIAPPGAGDGEINVNDLLMLISAWGPCAGCPSPACAADLHGDCFVDVADLLLLLQHWGACRAAAIQVQ